MTIQHATKAYISYSEDVTTYYLCANFLGKFIDHPHLHIRSVCGMHLHNLYILDNARFEQLADEVL